MVTAADGSRSQPGEAGPPAGRAAPLAGLTVIELANGLVGALAGQFLADYGAEVILVEPPGGTPLRRHPSWPFWGRGKRSIELDLSASSDRDVVRSLACRADGLVQAFRPGMVEEWRLDYETLRKQNPALVYTSVSGFGRHGPLSDLAGYEGVVLAKFGALAALADLTDRPGPSFPSALYSSYPAAQLAVQGLLAALYEREQTGTGQHVETSLAQGLTVHDTYGWFARVVASRFEGGFHQTPLSVKGVPSGGLSFRLLIALTADGHWVQFSQTVDRLFRAMMRMLALDWMFDDPEWASAPDFDDADRRVAFWERLLEAVRSRPLAEWRQEFDRDPDVWAEAFSRGDGVLDHPQMRWNGMVVSVQDPELGEVVQPGPAVRFPGSVPWSGRAAPRPGEHDAELRKLATSPTPPAREARGEAGRAAPLDGVTVLELGTYYAAPFGATLMADLGARVVKVEQLDGDPHRHMLPFPEVAGIKVLQGKESVAVDISSDAGREILHRLVRRADVVVQSFRAGVAERLQVDAAHLLEVNPRLIYLAAPGYGTGGPCGHRPAFAPTIGAAAGLAWRNAGPLIPESADLGLREIKEAAMRLAYAVMGVGNCDGFASVTVGSAIMLGLLGRRRGADVREMLTTMISSSAHALSEAAVRYEGRPEPPTADRQLFGLAPLYRLYETADGWVFLAAPGERAWAGLSGLVAGLAGDPRFTTAEGRERHGDELVGVLGRAFARRAAAEWESLLRPAGVACVEVAPGPVEANYLDEGSPGRASGFVTTTTHPMLDEVPRLAPLVTFSRSETSARGAGLLGDATERLLDELGYPPSEVGALRLDGVIRC